MRLLFFKPDLAWPRMSGHDVHCYYMMKALQDRGNDLALATLATPKAEATAGLALDGQWTLGEALPAPGESEPLQRTWMQRRFASYWGIEEAPIRRLAALASSWQADAVIADGLNVLPFLTGVEGACRIWFAADEWVWHHLSQTRAFDRATWGNVRDAAIKGVYERAHRSVLDRIWVVSDADRRAMQWVMGGKAIDVLPNGVDSDYYHPGDEEQIERSCVFWGRLDFGPNIQALQWFCRKVWPLLRTHAPGAKFTILGFKPTPPVELLARQDGIQLIPDLPDIRSIIRRHQVVVLPFMSGGGVKTKLLEAFALGKAVVGSQRACNGLFGPEPPLVVAKSPDQWREAILNLWASSPRRVQMGQAARQWVLEHHTWDAAARTVQEGLNGSIAHMPAATQAPTSASAR